MIYRMVNVLKILVIGLGSMGKRRIKLMLGYLPQEYEIVGVDTREDRRLEVENKFNIKIYADLDDAINRFKPDCALICTSPISHSSLIVKSLEKNLHVFTEINLLSDGYEEIIDLAKSKNLKLFLSSTFMYRKEITYIRERMLSSKEKHHYSYHVGQYLPDWHPWEFYKDFFVGDKRTNGCRELLAIELPWIIASFGRIKSIHTIKDKISSLDIDYPDSYIISIEHENGHKGSLAVDIVSRKPRRSLEIYSEKTHILWEGRPESLKNFDLDKKEMISIDTYSQYTRDTNYAENIIEDAYLEELITFFNLINEKEDTVRYTFEDDLYTLSIIDEIEGVKK